MLNQCTAVKQFRLYAVIFHTWSMTLTHVGFHNGHLLWHWETQAKFFYNCTSHHFKMDWEFRNNLIQNLFFWQECIPLIKAFFAQIFKWLLRNTKVMFWVPLFLSHTLSIPFLFSLLQPYSKHLLAQNCPWMYTSKYIVTSFYIILKRIKRFQSNTKQFIVQNVLRTEWRPERLCWELKHEEQQEEKHQVEETESPIHTYCPLIFFTEMNCNNINFI